MLNEIMGRLAQCALDSGLQRVFEHLRRQLLTEQALTPCSTLMARGEFFDQQGLIAFAASSRRTSSLT